MKVERSAISALLVALLLVPLAPGAALAQWPFGGPDADKKEVVKKAPVQVYKLSGQVREKASPWDLFGTDTTILLPDLLETIAEDAKSPDVKTLVFKVGGLSLGVAQAEELAGAIAAAKASGKKVIAHFESADLRHLAAVATADEVHMTPEGSLAMPGLQVEVSFYRDLLGTLGIQADIEAVGEFKSAMESFTRSTMSDAARKNLESLIDGLYGSVVEFIADGRKLSPEKVKVAIDQGLFTAEDAKKAGLITQLSYWGEVVDAAKAGKPGKGGELAAAIAWPRTKDSPEIGSLFDLMKLFSGDTDNKPDTGPKIAVLLAEGNIVDGRDPGDLFSSDSLIASEDFLDTLHTIENDPNVKAIVLRIDSPGGSALASDLMWRELARVGKKVPIVVSMGNVAASGGYYIASAAKKIFADATTLTGSIGVFGGKMVYQDLLGKVGVQTVVIARGKNAGMFSGLTRFSDSEREVLRRNMQHTYDTFVNRVAKGRNMSFDAVHKVAQGRVWTGRQAAEVGLVDKIGGLSDALAEARKLAKLGPEAPVESFPKSKTFMDLFDKSKSASKRIAMPSLLSLARGLPRPIAGHAERLAAMLELSLGREQVLALMPMLLTVR
jgi:protease-4